jgi:hypothetical protein
MISTAKGWVACSQWDLAMGKSAAEDYTCWEILLLDPRSLARIERSLETSPCGQYISRRTRPAKEYRMDLVQQPMVHEPERSPDRVRDKLRQTLIRRVGCGHL